MKIRAYYNEIDPNAAAWLRELIARKLITDGDVDERSIEVVKPSDLDGYTRCHFFAGIGIWDLALNLARWGSRPVWTASLPCQPFSDSGEGRGAEDDRNLWSVFHRLVEVKRPERVYGEQVAAAIGFDWLDRVQTDMEALGYLTGQAVLGAFSVGAPHIRRRLYWMADNSSGRREMEGVHTGSGGKTHVIGETGVDRSGSASLRMADSQNADGRSQLEPKSTRSGRDGLAGSGEPAFRLGNAVSSGLQGHAGNGDDGDQPGRIGSDEARPVAAAGAVVRMGDPDRDGCQSGDESREGSRHGDSADSTSSWASRTILCRDGKHRRIPVESDFFPLVDAGKYVVPGLARRRTVRPALLKGPGNAIVAQVAKVFIEVGDEALNEL